MGIDKTQMTHVYNIMASRILNLKIILFIILEHYKKT